MLLDGFSYVVLDVETTGLNPQEADAVCEIGAVKFRGNELIGEFSQLVNPRRPIPPLVSNLTGITDEMVKKSPSFAEVAPQLLDFLEDLPLFAYNAGFDMNFLNCGLQDCGRPEIKNPLVDILFICRKLFSGKLGRFSLKEVGDFLNLDTSCLHRALADAQLAAQVWQRAAAFLSQRGVSDKDMFLALFSYANYSADIWQDKADLFLAAIGERSPLLIKYFSYSRMEFVNLEILPLRLEERAGRHYLLGRHSGREESRRFNINRIVQASRS